MTTPKTIPLMVSIVHGEFCEVKTGVGLTDAVTEPKKVVGSAVVDCMLNSLEGIVVCASYFRKATARRTIDLILFNKRRRGAVQPWGNFNYALNIEHIA